MESLSKKTKSELIEEIVRQRKFIADMKEPVVKSEINILEDFFENLPIGVFVYKWEKPDKFYLINGNSEAKKLTGIDIKEWIGKEFNEIWPEARNSGISDLFFNAFTSREVYISDELFYKDDRMGGSFRTRAFRIQNDRLVVAFENITEGIRAKEQSKKRIAELKAITEVFSGINKCNSIEDILRIIGQKLYELDTEAYIFTSIYSNETDSIRILNFYGLEGNRSKVEKITGSGLFNMHFSVDELNSKQKQTYVNSKVEEINGGIYDIVLKKLSKKKCDEIERILGINKVFRIGFRLDKLPYGGVFILYKKNKAYPFRLTVETIVNYAKIEISRRLDNDLLRNEKEFSEVILNSINDTIIVYDLNKKLPLRWNKALNKISGYSNKEIKSMKFPDSWYDKKEIKKLGNKIQNYFIDARGRIELSLITKKGEMILSEYTGNLIKDDQDNPKYTISVGRDIRERNKMFKEIKEYSDKQKKMVDEINKEIEVKTKNLKDSQMALVYLAEDANEARYQLEKLNTNLLASYQDMESFSFSVSHDLKAPLRAIVGFSDILSEDYNDKLDSDGKDLLNRIIENASLMTKLTEDLLQFSRIGRSVMKFTKIDIKSIFLNELDKFEKENLTNSKEYFIGKIPKCRGDRSLLRVVISNLVSNAIKYSRNSENRFIEICAEQKDNECIYWVKDNGVGFDMKYHGSLFQVFKRLHHSDDFEGTGVGLAIVKRIVAKHDGEVWAEGELNKGARFGFSIPN